jgi:hypothetical protein
MKKLVMEDLKKRIVNVQVAIAKRFYFILKINYNKFQFILFIDIKNYYFLYYI